MSTTDALEICPLDSSHEILKSQMQFHVIRCMKTHKVYNKLICPYNAVHIIDKSHFQDHVNNCPDYKAAQYFPYEEDKKTLTGVVSMKNSPQAGDRAAIDGDWNNAYKSFKSENCEGIAALVDNEKIAEREDVELRGKGLMKLLHSPLTSEVAKSQSSRQPENMLSRSTNKLLNEHKLSETKLEPTLEENQKGNHFERIEKTKPPEKLQIPKEKPDLCAQNLSAENRMARNNNLSASKITADSNFRLLRGAKTEDKQKNDVKRAESRNEKSENKFTSDSTIIQLAIRTNIQKRLKELDEIEKNLKAERATLEALMGVRKFSPEIIPNGETLIISQRKASYDLYTPDHFVPKKLVSQQLKKIGRCAANFG